MSKAVGHSVSQASEAGPASLQVGLQLRRQREARLLSLDQAAQATRIRRHYLQALEEGDLQAIPSLPQARGFLRTYAGYLKLDPSQLLAMLEGKEVAADAPLTDQLAPVKPAVVSPVEKPRELPPEVEGRLQVPPPVVTTPPPAEAEGRTASDREATADPLFVQVGETLRLRRELLGFSLEDVERHTRLRQFYLAALEAGDLEGLPSPVQARGMLKNYAAFLGFDPDPLLLKFADGLQARLNARRPQATGPRRRPEARPPRRFLSMDFLVVATLSLLLGAFIMWSAVRVYRLRQQVTPTSSAPSVVEVLLAPPTDTLLPSAGPDTTTPLPTAGLLPGLPGTTQAFVEAPESGRGVQLNISVRQRAWMRVVVDGKVEFEGRVIPGSAYQFSGRNQIELLTGNGAALQVIFNQLDLGSLGGFGQVVNRIFAPQGVVTATPTITLTPTATLPPSATPSPTRTLRPGEATIPPFP